MPMPTLTEAVGAALSRALPDLAGKRVLAAVSGGPDSTALLLCLHELASGSGFVALAAHADHGLRSDAGADVEFVRTLCRERGIPLRVGRLRLRPGSNLEARARAARHAFLLAAALREGADAICLGHTRDDQVETVVMRLLRGTGPVGMAGIPPVRPAGVRGRGRRVAILHPLLEVSRRETVQYCRDRGMEPREDPSNRDPRHLRNRLRHQVLPLLRTLNPGLDAAVARLAALQREQNTVLAGLARDTLERIGRPRPGAALAVDAEAFLALGPALTRILVHQILARLSAGPFRGGTSWRAVESVLDVSRRRSGAWRPLGGEWIVRREGGLLVIARRDRPAAPFCYPLPVPGSVAVPEAGLFVTAAIVDDEGGEVVDSPSGERPAAPRRMLAEAHFDLERTGGALVLRSRRAGDRFQPAGMGGTKKLQDYFVDQKVPRHRRDRIALLATPTQIVWVCGKRADAGFLAGPRTRRRLVVRAFSA